MLTASDEPRYKVASLFRRRWQMAAEVQTKHSTELLSSVVFRGPCFSDRYCKRRSA